jgi:hypothetical protein
MLGEFSIRVVHALHVPVTLMRLCTWTIHAHANALLARDDHWRRHLLRSESLLNKCAHCGFIVLSLLLMFQHTNALQNFRTFSCSLPLLPATQTALRRGHAK